MESNHFNTKIAIKICNLLSIKALTWQEADVVAGSVVQSADVVSSSVVAVGDVASSVVVEDESPPSRNKNSPK